jgi:hypothetical protein
MSKKIEFQNTVGDENFWKSVDVALKILKPISSAILKMESRKSDLSDVYSTFQSLVSEFAADNEILELINKRWAFIHTESMGIAYFLNPKTKAGSDMVGTDRVDTIDQLEEYVSKNLSNKSEEIEKEIESFTHLVSNPSSKISRHIQTKSVKFFWNVIGEPKFPILAKVAKIVYSIPTSQAATERVWSYYDFIHSKRRNRLSVEKATKLVFLYARYLAKFKNEEIFDIIDIIYENDDYD